MRETRLDKSSLERLARRAVQEREENMREEVHGALYNFCARVLKRAGEIMDNFFYGQEYKK